MCPSVGRSVDRLVLSLYPKMAESFTSIYILYICNYVYIPKFIKFIIYLKSPSYLFEPLVQGGVKRGEGVEPAKHELLLLRLHDVEVDHRVGVGFPV